ncbi:MAG: hypothetical protein MI923_08925 [Phycisphaerales bacterium]|nr:hypothetical protein [Phycisphaerales bacterium]
MKKVVFSVCCLALAAVMTAGFSQPAEAEAKSPLTVSPSIAPLPRGITSFGAVVDGDWLYVIGGHWGERHHYSRETYSRGFRRLNLLDRMTWEELPGGVPLQSVALVAHDGYIYRVGGATARNAPDEANDMHSVDEVARFNIIAKRWESLPPLPQPRSSHDAVVWDGKLYAIGGWRLAGEAQEPVWYDTAYFMDLHAEELSWKPMPQPPFQRRAMGLAAANGKVYVIGGMRPDGKTTTRVDVFDVSTSKWERGPEYPKGEFHAIMACSVGDTIYANGLDGTLNRLRKDGAWEAFGPLSFPRFFHRLVAVSQEELLALGGAAFGGKIRQIESIGLKRGENRPCVSSWTIPFPGSAKNRQGVFFSENTLYVFGGNNSLGSHDFKPDNFVSEGFKVHLGSLTVSRLRDFPAAAQSMQTVVVGEGNLRRGYAVGGFGHDGSVARSQAETYRYNFRKNKWLSGPEMPSPRTQFGMVHHDDAIWVFGGLDYDPRRQDPDQFRHLSEVLRWDLNGSEDKFVRTDYELPRPRRAFAAATLGNRYYLVGGMRENFKPVPECDVFDFETKSWKSIPAPARPRVSPELLVLNGQLYLAGGMSPDDSGRLETNRSIEIFDPKAEKWSMLIDELPEKVDYLRMFAFGARLLIYSTHCEQTDAVKILLVDPGKAPVESSFAAR